MTIDLISFLAGVGVTFIVFGLLMLAIGGEKK